MTGVKSTFGVIITEDEINTFQAIASDWYNRTKTHYTPEYWVPIQWAQRLTVKALQNEYITEPRRAHHLLYVSCGIPICTLSLDQKRYVTKIFLTPTTRFFITMWDKITVKFQCFFTLLRGMCFMAFPPVVKALHHLCTTGFGVLWY